MFRLLTTIVSFATVLSACSAFSFFGSNKKTEVATIAPSAAALSFSSAYKITRGVPASSISNYENIQEFVCDNNSKSLPASSINDGFCDCDDGTDEPGTSACNNGVFYCQNVGYRPLKLTSSRVDDGLCDCCDGSDEGRVAICENKCAAMAEKEQAMIAKLAAAYTVGSKIRQEKEQSVRADLGAKASNKAEISARVDELNQIVDERRNSRNALKEKIDAITEAAKASAYTEARQLLQLDQIRDEHFAEFLKHALDASSITQSSEVTRMWNRISPNSDANEDVNKDSNDNQHRFTTGDDDVDDENEHHHHHHDDDEETHYDENAHSEDFQTSSGDAVQEVEVASDSSEPVAVDGDLSPPPVDPSPELQSTCPLYVMSKFDDRFKPFCNNGDDASITNAKKFLFESLLKHYTKPYVHIQKLLNGYKSHGVFSSESLQQEVNDDTLSKRLHELYRIFDESYETIHPDDELSKSYNAADQSFRDSQLELSTVEAKKSEADEADRDMENYKNNLGFLAYKNECFSTSGGHYTYTACFFKGLTQKETDSHNSVSLGDFALLEERDDGSFMMKYSEGQHCWNHGARAAEVHIKCGPNNSLLSAREPSTCYYALEMESPLACTEKFKEFNGIV